jgi:hypothetical protein
LVILCSQIQIPLLRGHKLRHQLEYKVLAALLCLTKSDHNFLCQLCLFILINLVVFLSQHLKSLRLREFMSLAFESWAKVDVILGLHKVP